MKKIWWGFSIGIIVIASFCCGLVYTWPRPAAINSDVGITSTAENEAHGLGATFDPTFVERLTPAESAVPLTKRTMAASSSTLPAAYSLRDDYVIYTQNQQSNGLCWAFASTTALSTTLMKGTGQYYDFSEAWTGLAAVKVESNYKYGDGGNTQLFTKAMSAHGLMLESDFPYDRNYLINNSNANTYYNFYQQYADTALLNNITLVSNFYYLNKDTIDDASINAVCAQLGLSAAIVKSALNYLGYYKVESQLTAIKQHILDQGAMTIGMYWNNLATNTSSGLVDAGDYLYKKPGQHTVGSLEAHMVTIIGWDDNFSYGGQTGAWVCLNSWGDSIGHDGVFYVMYYDADLFGYADGFTYQPASTTDLYYNNQITTDSGYQAYNTSFAGKYYSPYTCRSSLTKQRNLYFGSGAVNLRYRYQTNGTVTAVKVYYNQADITARFDAAALNVDNNDFALVAQELAPGPYRVVVTYQNGTATNQYTNVFYVLNGSELSSVEITGYGGTTGVDNNGRYYYYNTYNYPEIELSLAMADTRPAVSATVRFYYATYTAERLSRAYDSTYFSPATQPQTYTVGANTVKINYNTMGTDYEYLVDFFYDTAGGTNHPDNNQRQIVSKATGIELRAPTKPGYLFAGWYYDANRQNKIVGNCYLPAKIISVGATSTACAANYYNYYLKNSRAAFAYAKWIALPEAVLNSTVTAPTADQDFTLTAGVDATGDFTLRDFVWRKNGTLIWQATDATLAQSLAVAGVYTYQATFVLDNYGEIYEYTTPELSFTINQTVMPTKTHTVTYQYDDGTSFAGAVDDTAYLQATDQAPAGYRNLGWYFDEALMQPLTDVYIAGPVTLYGKMTLLPIQGVEHLSDVRRRPNEGAVEITIAATHAAANVAFTYAWYFQAQNTTEYILLPNNTATLTLPNNENALGQYYCHISARDLAGRETQTNTNVFAVEALPAIVPDPVDPVKPSDPTTPEKPSDPSKPNESGDSTAIGDQDATANQQWYLVAIGGGSGVAMIGGVAIAARVRKRRRY